MFRNNNKSYRVNQNNYFPRCIMLLSLLKEYGFISKYFKIYIYFFHIHLVYGLYFDEIQHIYKISNLKYPVWLSIIYLYKKMHPLLY